MTQDAMTQDAWLNNAIDSVVEGMIFQLDSLGKTKEQAIAAVKLESCAGIKPWKIALDHLASIGK